MDFLEMRLTHKIWEGFASTHPFWDKVFAFAHPKKLYFVRSMIVPPLQQQE